MSDKPVPSVIVTHSGVDLDNGLATAAIRRFIPGFARATIKFVLATWHGTLSAGQMAVDIDADGLGLKGDVDADGTVHSAFKKMLELARPHVSDRDWEIVQPFIRIVDAHDAFGGVAMERCMPGIHPEMARFLTEMSIVGVSRGFKTAAYLQGKELVGKRPDNWSDHLMMDVLDDVFAGLFLKEGKRQDPLEEVLAFFRRIVDERLNNRRDELILRDLITFLVACRAYGDDVMQYLVPQIRDDDASFLCQVSIINVYYAYKATFKERARRERKDAGWVDACMLQTFRVLVGGMYHGSLNLLRAQEAIPELIKSGGVEVLPEGRVVICRNVKNGMVSTALLAIPGVRAVVIVDRHGLIARRKDGESIRMDHPLVRSVVEQAGESVGSGENDTWFAHRSGFIFARGTKKAPAKTRSKVDPLKLAEAVDRVIYEKGGERLAAAM